MPQAEVVIREVLRIKSQSTLAHFYLGRVLTQENKFDEAEKELLSSLNNEDPQTFEAHRMLADMYLKKGDQAAAVKRLETYLKLVPKAPDADKLRHLITQLKQTKT